MPDTEQMQLPLPGTNGHGKPGPVFSFRKADPPRLGTAFDQKSQFSQYSGIPGSQALMFDLDKLTLADYSNMRSHPQINASLSLMSFMLHQIDWKITCERQDIADVVEENMHLIWTPLVRGLGTAYWAGYSPIALEWDNESSGRWLFIDKIKDLAPEDCRVHWKEVESNYVPRPEDVLGPPGKVIKPKVKIYDGIDKFGLGYPIRPEHTLWYPCLMERGDYYGRNLLKPAFMPWYFSIIIHLFANRYFERFGEPVPVGRAPLEREYTFMEDGNLIKISAKMAMEAAIDSVRSGGKVVLPSDRDETATGNRSEYEWDIEYLEAQMRGADFERYLARLDEEISLSIFTPMLLMRSGDRGSLNLGVQHTQTWLTALNSMAADLKVYIDQYLCQRIKAYNFSPNAPRVEWEPRSMGKDNSETLRAIVVELIRGGTVKPDLEEMGVALGMTLKQVQQVLAPTAAVDDRQRTERTDRTADKPNLVNDDRPRTVSG
jgi:hypothetical protein